MSQALKECWPIILLLAKATPRMRQSILRDVADNKEICYVIREIFHNYFKGNLKLSPEDEKKVKRHSKVFKQIISMKKDLKTSAKRKKAFRQVGGVLPLIIQAAIPLITSLLMQQQ